MKRAVARLLGRLWGAWDIPALGTQRYYFLVGLYRLLPWIGGINYSRLTEWEYVLSHLPPTPARILDAGSATSLFAYKLLSAGYRVHCLDHRDPQFTLSPRISFHRDNLMRLGITDGVFDAVSCISVIEHIGRGKYDDPLASNGDAIAIQELLRVLKPGGKLVITTNIARTTCIHNNEMRYGRDRLEGLFALGSCASLQYRIFDGRRWIIASPERAFLAASAENYGLAMFVLIKS